MSKTQPRELKFLVDSLLMENESLLVVENAATFPLFLHMRAKIAVMATIFTIILEKSEAIYRKMKDFSPTTTARRLIEGKMPFTEQKSSYSS
jgi:hypothetical protein